MPQKVKLADKLYDHFSQMIASGEWAAGSRIPAETDLAHLNGVSRPVVREALIRLRADGLLGPRGRTGNFVLVDGDERDAGYRPIENVADLIQVFEFRFSMECDIAALAAIRRDDSDMNEIRKAGLTLMGEASEETFGDADFRFHIALAKASRNAMFVSTMSMLRRQIEFGMRLVGEFKQGKPTNRVETVLEEHEAVIEAVSRKDADAAHAAMGEHIAMSRRRLLGFELPVEWQRSSHFVSNYNHYNENKDLGRHEA
ncbi:MULTISPECIES: FadR/GntR family transcriptional regulator [unclassified Rhizobium]|uniref:FadR/GntR family transcriptional regulator n=1 Tax=unclassified Rhizobium TaxID=2613769 RepID=UPI000BEA2048|nr:MULTISPECIES: FadR/GntR family transcriptional regulator [unclassified Rhizobium]MDF0661698.1 FadR/GntR family transcriptional regulator [Rhizobium sp. BC49]PDS87504.1 GntR family transcriptional regulator [Rhizobium sp. L18]